MTNQQRVTLYLIPVFLVLYVIPILVAAFAMPFGGMNGEAPVGRWFFFVLTDPSDPMALMQRLLLPMTGFVTVVGLWSQQGIKFAGVLIGITVVSIVAVAALWWFLIVPDNALNLWQPVQQNRVNPIDTPEEFDPVARTYLLGRFESLAAYLAVLIGISIKP